MAGDANNTTARWLPFHRSLAWLRQRCPGATDKWAYGKLQQALLEEICRLSEGVPIDKFRYPYGSGTADLVILIRNNHLTFEDIRWQNVECNLEWLERDFEWFERDWPPPALEVEAAPVPAEDAALKPIEPAAPEPAPPSKFAVSKPVQSSLEVPAPVSPPPQKPTPIVPPVEASLAASPAQETPWPSVEQLGIVKAPKQKTAFECLLGLSRRHPKQFGLQQVLTGAASGEDLAHRAGVSPDVGQDLLRAIRTYFAHNRASGTKR